MASEIKESNRKRVNAFYEECVVNGLEGGWDVAWGYVAKTREGRIVIKLSWPDMKSMSILQIREYVKTEAVLWCFR